MTGRKQAALIMAEPAAQRHIPDGAGTARNLREARLQDDPGHVRAASAE
jgi:hypothetical protein